MSLFSRQESITGIIIPEAIIFSANTEDYLDRNHPQVLKINSMLEGIALVGTKECYVTFPDSGYTRIWMSEISGMRPLMKFRVIEPPAEDLPVEGCDEREEGGFHIILNNHGEEWTHPAYNMPGVLWLSFPDNDYIFISDDAREFKNLQETFVREEGENFKGDVYNNRSEITAAIIMQMLCHEDCALQDGAYLRVSDIYDDVANEMYEEVKRTNRVVKKREKDAAKNDIIIIDESVDVEEEEDFIPEMDDTSPAPIASDSEEEENFEDDDSEKEEGQ